MNTNFYMPTKVVLAEDCITKNTSLFKSFGKKALIVTGANSSKRNGALQDITMSFASLEIEYEIFDRVMANPTIQCVYEGASLARTCKADFVIGIGGGSPMDAAKAIALLAIQNIPEEDIFTAKIGDEALPIIMVPTTAGTGSEVTPYSILTSDLLQTKKSISSPALFPKLAFLDAKYMRNLSKQTTIHTALDALSHAMEGMLSVRATEISNCIAVESIKVLTRCLQHIVMIKDNVWNLSFENREHLLYGSMLAGIVITHTGTTAVHSMGYSLTYFKNVDHGRANALLLPAFLRFIAIRDQNAVKKILIPMEMNSIEEMEELFKELIGKRESITVHDAEKFTSISMAAKNVTNSVIIPSKEDIYQIYSNSLNLVKP